MNKPKFWPDLFPCCSMKFLLRESRVTPWKDRSSPSYLKKVPVYFLPPREGQDRKAIMTQLRTALAVESDRQGWVKASLPT